MTYTIEQIEELLEKAMPGPWKYFNRYTGVGFVYCAGNEDVVVTDTELSCNGKDHACVRSGDGELIAASREIIPQLLAELKAKHQTILDLTEENYLYDKKINELGEKNKVAVEGLRSIARSAPMPDQTFENENKGIAMRTLAKMGVEL